MSGCVREEVDTLTREYEWLVATELPSMFKDIGRLLEAIVAQLAPDPRTTRPSRIPISCPNGHLRGHVVVLGACVTQAEVERRLPKKGNTSGNPTEFSTRIDSDTPYRIDQAHTCLAACQAALASLEDHLQFRQNSPCTEIVHFLKAMVAQLQRAKEALVFDRNQVPEEYFRQLRSFKPPLQHDTTLEFHIKNGRLIARCLRIAPLPTVPSQDEVRQAKQPFMLGGSMKGYVFKHRDTWMVVDAEEIGLCEVPTFSSVLGLLHDAQHLTQAVTSQLSVFQALDADLQRHGHVRGLNSPTTVETA